MAENDQENDEYRFVELDNPNDEQMSEEEPLPESASFSGGFQSQKDIKRNALIAILVIVLIMFLYKLVGYVRSEKKDDVVVQKTQQQLRASKIVSTKPVQQEVISAPITTPITPAVSTSNNAALSQKVNEIELAQQSMQTDMATVSQQVNTVNNNITNVNNQLNNLQQVINNLAAQLEKQSHEMALITEKTKPKKIFKPASHLAIPSISYAIQAIIPGRAWLIASNGSTITVREGIKIRGYGTVSLIDALEGRVLTSSGKVIRFSQEDS